MALKNKNAFMYCIYALGKRQKYQTPHTKQTKKFDAPLYVFKNKFKDWQKIMKKSPELQPWYPSTMVFKKHSGHLSDPECTLSQKYSKSPQKNQACHSWSRCNGIYFIFWQIYVNKSRTDTVASAPAVTSLVFMRRFRLFLGQCGSWCSWGTLPKHNECASVQCLLGDNEEV